MAGQATNSVLRGCETFDRHTKDKAGKRYRLLILDGHGSHITTTFLKWCKDNRVLVAIYPPHSTHRLQPLDVSLFSPLSTFYTQQLNDFIFRTQGLTRLNKSDFFMLFWPAYSAAFTAKNIALGWSKTGLYPLDGDVIIKQVKKQPPPPREQRPDSKGSSTGSHLSALDWRKAEALIESVVARSVTSITDKEVKKLSSTLYHLSTKVSILEAQNQGLREAVFHEQGKHTRSKTVIEEFRAEEQGGGGLFMSPQKIQDCEDREASKEVAKQAEKEAKAAAKKEQKKQKLIDEEAKAVQRQLREDQLQQQRASAARARASKQLAKDNLHAQQQLQKDLQASVKKTRQYSKQQPPQLPQPVFHNIEVNERQPNQASPRKQRIRKPPPYLSDYQVDM